MEDKYIMLAGLITLVAGSGLVISTKSPVAGFILVMTAVLTGIVAVTVNLKKKVNHRLPDFSRPNRMNDDTMTWGFLTLAVMTVFVFSEFLVVVSIIAFMLGLVKLLLETDVLEKGVSSLDDEELIQPAIMFGLGGLFLIAATRPTIILLPAGITLIIFIITLLPEKHRKDFEVIGLD